MKASEDRVDLDLNSVTVDELTGLSNPVLKRVLLQAKKRMDDEASGSAESAEASKFCLHNVFYNYEKPPEPPDTDNPQI